MKKYIFSALAIAAMMVSCNNQSPKMDEQPAAGETSASGLKIAYVEVDSLMTQYDFAKDYSVTLQKKSNNARNTLTTKGNALQAAVNNFQQKLRDSLQNFLKDYNKDKQFSLILTKQGDNILLADKRFDITNDVINGLNKRYKPAPKKADEKAEEKK